MFVFANRERRREKEREDLWRKLDKLNAGDQSVHPASASPSRTRRRKKNPISNSDYSNTISGNLLLLWESLTLSAVTYRYCGVICIVIGINKAVRDNFMLLWDCLMLPVVT